MGFIGGFMQLLPAVGSTVYMVGSNIQWFVAYPVVQTPIRRPGLGGDTPLTIGWYKYLFWSEKLGDT